MDCENVIGGSLRSVLREKKSARPSVLGSWAQFCPSRVLLRSATSRSTSNLQCAALGAPVGRWRFDMSTIQGDRSTPTGGHLEPDNRRYAVVRVPDNAVGGVQARRGVRKRWAAGFARCADGEGARRCATFGRRMIGLSVPLSNVSAYLGSVLCRREVGWRTSRSGGHSGGGLGTGTRMGGSGRGRSRGGSMLSGG